jgi:hypothetical protein
MLTGSPRELRHLKKAPDAVKEKSMADSLCGSCESQ